MKKILTLGIICLIPFIQCASGDSKDAKDAANKNNDEDKTVSHSFDSYKGLVMAGYQGWFNTPDDGADRGWYHYKGANGFKPGSCSIDYWPEVTEYEKTYKTEFSYDDRTPAYVFSSHDESTVDTHFRWMKEYGLDGVFMQRFIGEVTNPSGKAHFNKVLASAIKASKKYDRAICVMYDLSGMKAGNEMKVLQDMDELLSIYHFDSRKDNPTYLYHNKKPLVVLWGVGFNDKRAYGLKEVEYIMNGLRKRGFSIMLGVPTYWRTLDKDTESDPALHRIIMASDIIMPWFVGRYNEDGYPPFKDLIMKDIAWCKQNNVDYVPLAFPGFSWRNMYGSQSTQIPRNKGSFLWKQISGSIELGAEMLYIAMFDEVDEGTAIFKCAKKVPIGESVFVPIEKEIQSDHYLWLTGQGARMLRKEIPFTSRMPERN